MKLLLSTACFPPVEYFVFLMRHKMAWIDCYETYPKQTWRNRYLIIGGNGPCSLSVPVEKPFGNTTKTIDIVISKHAPWQQNHWKTIYSAYRNAPFFIYYCDLVEDLILKTHEEKLVNLNKKVIDALITELEIPVTIAYTEHFVAEAHDYLDMRFCISPKSRDQKNCPPVEYKPYYQVFEDRHGFVPNPGILDLIFNLGPDAVTYLEEAAEGLE